MTETEVAVRTAFRFESSVRVSVGTMREQSGNNKRSHVFLSAKKEHFRLF